MPMNSVFISNITSALGRCLHEQFRDDHFNLHDFRTIRGTVTEQGQADDKTFFHFSSNQNLALKSAMESDLVILDLCEPTLFDQLLMRYLKRTPLRKPIRVIGLSLFTNWGNTKKCYQAQGSTMDPLQMLKQDVPFYNFRDESYLQRVPMHHSIYNYQLENLLLSLSYNPSITPNVVCRGLLYGKDYSELHQLFSTLITYRSKPVCFGRGSNYIPLVHVDDLCRMVYNIAQKQITQPYLVAVDDSNVTQLQLLNCLSQSVGLFKQTPDSIHHQYGHLFTSLFCGNVKIERSQQLDDIEWTCRGGILTLKEGILQEFNNNVKYQVARFVIVGPNASLRQSVEKALSNDYGDRLVINTSVVADYISSVQQFPDTNPCLAALLQQNTQDTRTKKDQPVQHSSVVQEKALQTLVHNNRLRGYIINVSDAFSFRANLSSKTLAIQCEHPQQVKPQETKPPTAFQAATKQSQPDKFQQKYLCIPCGSRQFQKLFRGYIEDPEEMQVPATQTQRDSKSQSSESSQQDIGGEKKNESIPSQVGEIKNRISMMSQSENISLSMKQYLTDMVMPFVVGGIYQIQQQKPQNITQYFVQYLKRQSGSQDLIQKLKIFAKSGGRKQTPPS